MIESDLTRDVTSNYLTLASEDARELGYDVKMFAGKTVPGFLDMTIRRVDGKNVYQYRILSYSSVCDRYSKDSISKKDIKNLVTTLIKINVTVNEYLLNPDYVVLDPQYIYVDGEVLYFCYCPDNSGSFVEGIRSLMEYVLEHINHDDRDTVMTAYGLYQRILKNSYTLESLMEVFDKNTLPQESSTGQDNNIYQKQSENAEYSAHLLSTNTLSEHAMVKESMVYDFFEEKEDMEEGIWSKIKKFFYKKKESPREMQAEGTMVLCAKRFVSLGGSEDIILTHYPFIIGSRQKNCDYTINNPMISRKHVVIWNDGGEFYVEDIGSTNGTKINELRLPSCEKIKLSQGDIVEFADLKYRFE